MTEDEKHAAMLEEVIERRKGQILNLEVRIRYLRQPAWIKALCNHTREGLATRDLSCPLQISSGLSLGVDYWLPESALKELKSAVKKEIRRLEHDQEL
jgi:hypothetical protein